MRFLLFYISFYLLISCHSKSSNTDIDSSLVTTPPKQSLNLDTLKRYTYLVLGSQTNNGRLQGCGFFIRKNKKLYFVSALHVFLGIQGKVGTPEKDLYNEDSLAVIIAQHQSTFDTLKIPTKKIKETVQQKLFYQEADAFAYPINLNQIPKNDTIFSIENFVELNYNCSEITEAITLGFSKTESNGTTLLAPALSFENILFHLCKNVFYKGENITDSINYVINMQYEGEGFSGSPVFMMYRNKPIFGGLMSTGDPVDKWVIIVRPQYVLNKVK